MPRRWCCATCPTGTTSCTPSCSARACCGSPWPTAGCATVAFAADEEFLAGLTRKHRYHQRTRVLAVGAAFDVEVLAGGSPAAAALPAAHRDVLYDRYRACTPGPST